MRFAVRTLLTAAITASLLFGATPGHAAQGDCAQPSSNGSSPTASDCLFILVAAVGAATCDPECICAPGGSLPISATDALVCLSAAVGNPVSLDCPCGSGGAYEAEALSFIREIEMPFVDVNQENPDIDCCKDFGPISRDFIEEGTNRIDNMLTLLNAVLTEITGSDVGLSVNSQIEKGKVVLLLDHQNVDTGSTPDPFNLVFLQGGFTPGTDYADASAGDGEFDLNAESFMPGTEMPNIVFDTATYDDTTLAASGGTFQTVFPFGGQVIDVAINDAEIDGMHTGITDGGLAYEGATVAGWVSPEQLLIAVHGVLLSDSCSCLGLTGPVYEKDSEGVWTATGCIEDAESLCPEPSKRNCVALAEVFDIDDEEAIGLCEVVPDALFGLADLNLEGDTETYEGISAGLRFRASPGALSGTILP